MLNNHRCWKILAAGLLFSVIAVSVVIACVVPRNLTEQIAMAGDEIAVGTIQNVTELSIREADGGTFPWTRVDLQVDESMLSGRTDFSQSFYFRGGVKKDSPTTSVAPSAEDIQVGRKLMLFLGKRPAIETMFGAGSLSVDSYAEVFRVIDATTSTGKKSVVMGKGAGFAFEANTDLVAVRDAVKIEVAKRKQTK